MRKSASVIAAAIAAVLAIPAVAGAAGAADERPIPGQYIVVLKGGVDVDAVVAEHRRGAKAEVLVSYEHALSGYAAKLSASGLARVKADPRVESVQQDVEGKPLTAKAPSGGGGGGGGTSSSTMPTGVNRIDAELATATTLATADSTTKQTAGNVAVMDTGIQTNHPDLVVPGGVNCLGSYTGHDGTIGDENGHGTHVAGTVGAKDDGAGVVGAAPGVRVWSVRVLNNIGSGSTSTQLCGIDWVTANGPALGIRVVNASMALFGSPDDGNCGYTAGDVLHQAICRSTGAGILWVFSAGNSGGSWAKAAGSSYPEVLAVTAAADSNGQPNVGSTSTFTCKPPGSKTSYTSQTDDKYASFSSYAVSDVDISHTIAAPGACIYSTYKGSSYGHMSGTSMAAPHAAAVAHRCILSGQCAGSPAETIQRLRADAHAWNGANPGWGFAGDPLRPVSGRYYGHLSRAAQY